MEKAQRVLCRVIRQQLKPLEVQTTRVNSLWSEDKSPHSSVHVLHYPNIYYSSSVCVFVCARTHVLTLLFSGKSH